MSTSGRGKPQQSLGELVSGVTTDVSSLVRLEIELAKSELQAQAKQGGVGIGLALLAGALSVLALILLSVAAAFAIATALPTWAGFLIVGGVYLLVAVILLLIGVRRLKRVKGPGRAQASVAETKQVLADRTVQRHDAKAAGLTVPELIDQRSEQERMSATQAAAREAARTPFNSG